MKWPRLDIWYFINLMVQLKERLHNTLKLCFEIGKGTYLQWGCRGDTSTQSVSRFLLFFWNKIDIILRLD